MLTAGSDRDDAGSYDVLYVMPMEWLLKDIREHGIDVVLMQS